MNRVLATALEYLNYIIVLVIIAGADTQDGFSSRGISSPNKISG